ncbi:MAG: two-component system, response regulator PdtaR [Clostridia bacterium]|jgi:response regulator NasT|nr:two-component system, response regulator PdtaR [Clostridia bacterium]
MDGFRIIIAEHNTDNLHLLTDLLMQEGHSVVAKVSDSASLLHNINTVQPDAIILNSTLPGENFLELLYKLQHLRIAPVIIVSEELDLNLLEDSIKSRCFGYLVYPIYSENLIPVLEYAVNYFKIISQLEEENKELKEREAQRKTIERAKNLLIEKKEISEREAYNLLRKLSMDKCVSMHKIASTVIKTLENKL